MKRLLLALFTASLLLSSCEERERGTYRNENIDEEVMMTIRNLDAQIAEHLRDGEVEKLRSLMSDALLASSGEAIEAFVERAQRSIENKQYTTVDQYHRIGSADETVALISGTEHEDDYIIQYQSITDESFVSVLAPKREGDSYLLTNFYGLYDGEWKLNIVQFDRYSVSGYTAVQLYHEAKKELDKGHVVNAFNRMLLAQSVSEPAGGYWQFRIQSEMDAFNDSLMTLAREAYPIPMTIAEVASEPVIFQITPQRVDNEICTMIKYVTEINIKDTTALAAENKALHQYCLDHFNGVGEDVPFIFYRAFNEMPKTDVSTPYFGFVRPLDERLL